MSGVIGGNADPMNWVSAQTAPRKTRMLPIRVRAFVDFAVGYMTKALGSSSINDTKSDINKLDFVSSR
jgi:hypothetical protein